MRLIYVGVLYHLMWFRENREHCARDIAAEICLRNGIYGLKAFAGWHYLAYFDMKSFFRSRYYVTVPTLWERYEPIRLLLYPSPSVYVYYSFE